VASFEDVEERRWLIRSPQNRLFWRGSDERVNAWWTTRLQECSSCFHVYHIVQIVPCNCSEFAYSFCEDSPPALRPLPDAGFTLRLL